MAHGKETPRQKMIGMMYLVLTALLALNVSKDVLDAFTLVDEGLTQTTSNFAEKNSSYYSDFAAAYELNKTKVEEWKNKAEEVRERSNELYDFIQDCKVEIVTISEGEDSEALHEGKVELSYVVGKENTDIPAEVMIRKGRGEELKDKMDEHTNFLLSLIDDKEAYASVVAAIEGNLDTSDPEPDPHAKGEKTTWVIEHFESLPLASVVTILSKMQSDVRNTEAEILSFLLSQIDAGSFKFNKIEPIVIANSDYVFKGQEYKARIFLAAYDSTKAPIVKLNNNEELPVEEGKGIYVGNTASVGPKKWGGTIILEGETPITRKFEAQYQVAEASAVISPTKMNVFYRGVKNPVAISVSGVPKEDIQAEITKGSIRRSSGGDWEVMPASGPEGEVVSVRVYANVDNTRRFMGKMDFRVKNVPPPVAKIAGRSQGAISLTDLSRTTGVEAELEDFDFELEYTVTEFTVSAVLSGGFTTREKSTSDKYTQAQKDIIRQLGTGKNFTVTDIKAVGPDGRVVPLNSIVLRIL
ncbi:MAG: gliding motility protein GldM [Bacteroidales bacterium]